MNNDILVGDYGQFASGHGNTIVYWRIMKVLYVVWANHCKYDTRPLERGTNRRISLAHQYERV